MKKNAHTIFFKQKFISITYIKISNGINVEERFLLKMIRGTIIIFCIIYNKFDF